jgi:transcriptional regulator with XRE-family HTH domain
MTLGQRVRKRREAMKLTQQKLAEALSVTPQHISAVEKDKRTPSLDSLARLAEELGVTIDFLVTGKESVITDTIPAIRADKKLNIEMKRALITLIRALYTEDEKV